MGCACGKKRTVWNSRQAEERRRAASEGTPIMDITASSPPAAQPIPEPVVELPDYFPDATRLDP